MLKTEKIHFNLSLSVFSSNDQKVDQWIGELKLILEGPTDIVINKAAEYKEYGQIIFVDGTLENLDSILEKIDRRGRAIFLVMEAGSALPPSLIEGRVDDLVVAPFRTLEVLSKLRHYDQILMWNEVVDMSASFSEALSKLSEDLGVAERLQKAKVPKRIEGVKGFQISSRYLAGMRSGGDYFDVAESRDQKNVSIILSHSSSYGLSSAILSSLMRVTLKLTTEKMGESGTITETLQKVYEELVLLLGEKDQLSLFYGNIVRKTQVLRFLNLGSAGVFFSQAEGSVEELSIHGPSISKGTGFSPLSETEVHLIPQSRLILVSDGFIQMLGGRQKVGLLLNQFRNKEALDSLNELIFHVKSQLDNKDDLPVQDCTAAIFDVESQAAHILKFTKPEQDET